MHNRLFRKMLYRDIMKNKVSSLLMIFTISLVSILLCVISSTVNIYADASLQSNEYAYGTWVYAYDDTSISNQTEIEKSHENAKFAYVSKINQGSFQDSKFTIKGLSDQSKILPFHLIKGKLPQKHNEIVICESLSFDSQFQIGKSVQLKAGAKYKIIGIINDSILSINPDIYTLYTNLDEKGSDKVDLYYSIPMNFNKASSYIKEITTQKKNQEILSAYETYDDTIHYRSGKEMIWFFLVVASIIFICMGIVIHNMYRLSFQSRNSYFHLLKQNNFTAKQIKKLSFYEMIVLSLVGIGLGILLTYGILQISFVFLNPIFQAFMDVEIQLNVIIAWKLFGLCLMALLIIQTFTFFQTYQKINHNQKKRKIKIKQF